VGDRGAGADPSSCGCATTTAAPESRAAVVHRDELLDADGDGVAGSIGIGVVVRQLQAGHEQQSERRERSGPLSLDLTEVRVEVLGVHARPSVASRPRIVLAQDVVGHAQDVESGRSVEIDQLA
jgi:hypothetical protein